MAAILIDDPPRLGGRRPSRRTFLKAVAMGGAVGGLGLWRPEALAYTDVPRPPVSLAGTEFDLTIGETLMNVTGTLAPAVTVNGSVPAPTLRWREGDTVTLRVTNTLREDTSIHWHGILLPASMDGVPGLSFDGVRPGETQTYRFVVRQAGNLLVPQPLGVPRTARDVRRARHRSPLAGALRLRS